MYRLDNGQPIRKAMEEAGLSIEGLADKTKATDPTGYGISRSAIGHMVSTGPSGRERFEDRSCALTAAALGKPVEELFTNTPTTPPLRASSFHIRRSIIRFQRKEES